MVGRLGKLAGRVRDGYRVGERLSAQGGSPARSPRGEVLMAGTSPTARWTLRAWVGSWLVLDVQCKSALRAKDHARAYAQMFLSHPFPQLQFLISGPGHDDECYFCEVNPPLGRLSWSRR